jgi:hypothetical protein
MAAEEYRLNAVETAQSVSQVAPEKSSEVIHNNGLMDSSFFGDEIARCVHDDQAT